VRVPDWFVLVVLALASFRTWRLVARDTILDWPRNVAVGLPRRWSEGDPIPAGYREHLAVWIECMWCQGFYHAVGWWAAWVFWPHATVWVAVPWALSALLALAAKNLDD
jgi:uncharacterized protein DUF1360